MSSTDTYDDLLAAIEEHDWELPTHIGLGEIDHAGHARRGEQLRQSARQAIQAAADEPPADHVRAIPVRQLIVEAPALPPIKMPKLSERTLNGKAVTRCVEAGERAGIVHTPQGVRIVADLDDLEDDPTLVVIAQQAELRYLIVVDGKEPLDVARTIIDRESKLIESLKAAA